ncbi:cytochrome P450 2K6-like [Hyla sarda]|uniref:cytochrome P450 2K6-like n=1 Tax=Hyla sarda TaxID=327740 RepID=UPI0024C30EC6|nr:cytochrome P450 2K6-like [Hyla sarda]
MEPVSIILSVVVILFLAGVYKNQKKYKYENFPPGPKPLPIIGNIHMIDTLKPQKSFMEMSKKYGTIFSIQSATKKFVVLCGYDTVKEALINYAEEFSGRPVTPMGARTSQGCGILFSNGENWKVMRRFTLSTLRDYGMGKKGIEEKITEECESLMETFRSYRGKPFDNQTIINAAVANIIVSILMDHRYEYNDPTILKLMRLVNENIRISGSTMIRISKKYGTIFSLQIGQEKFVILCGYETVKDALMNYGEEISGRPKSPIFNITSAGYGVLFSHGDNWKAMRKFTLSTLRDFGMGKKTTENKIAEECEHLIQAIRSYEGKPFDNQTVINTAVANIIVSILLDHRFEYDDPIVLKLMSLLNENIRMLESGMVRLYNSYPNLVGWLPGSHRKVAKNYKEMGDFMMATFVEQRGELDVNNQRSFIDAFLAKQQEGKSESELYFHNKNLCILMMDLFAAGMETTSTTLRWGLLLMIKYPEVQKKVQNEIENVIGTAQPQTEHRKQMPYTDAVIHEIQRFGDIVPVNLPHATIKDLTFKGYLIPKGTTVIPLLHSVLRDRACFKKPEEFYPEHFLDSKGNFKKNEAFVPFSLGKRSCAGENLAKMELFLFFTTLLQNFTFQAPPGAKLDLHPAEGFTNAPLPYEICAIPRR